MPKAHTKKNEIKLNTYLEKVKKEKESKKDSKKKVT